jgi:fructan beta-fructosidase
MKKYTGLALPLLIIMSCKIAYCQDFLDTASSKYLPEYHFFPSIDPAGLFYSRGKYYLNWGTAESNDLVYWKMTEYGLERTMAVNSMFGKSSGSAPFSGPGSPFQSQVVSIESGSAVMDWNNASGLSTGNLPPVIAFQSRGIAYSLDSAINWIKYESLPVIENATGSGDPKMFWYEPEKKWVLLMGWTNGQKIKFFSSENLKDWKYMSEFGPWGATNAPWNCVDFFQLPVDGNPSELKWVLVVSVQTCNGQYFIGDFDGTRFTMDKEFIGELSYQQQPLPGAMLFNFERGIDDWIIEGDAFVETPLFAQNIMGKEGQWIASSAHNRIASKGKITSPEFTINKKYLNFLIGGGYYPADEAVNLLVDGKTVRSCTGNDRPSTMSPAGWDVSEYYGKKAKIEIVDNITQGMSMSDKGYIYLDAIMLSDKPVPESIYNQGWENAFWADWGSDFYAARSWSNLAPGDGRIVWVGWMGNHLYRQEPIFGIISVARSLELKTLPEGIRLIQKPVKELETLRISHKTAEPNVFEGTWIPRKFLPDENSYELLVEFENISSREFGLRLCVGENEKTVVGYDVTSEVLYVDRNSSGYDDFSKVFQVISRGPLKNRSNNLKLHIFVDKCSVEVFGNDGETVISDKIYPSSGSLGIELFSNGGKIDVRSLELWNLDSIDLYSQQ